jgi:hypothetical protein
MFGHNKLHQCLIQIILHFMNYFNVNISYVLPEDNQELRPEQVAEIIKKNIVR